jgi:hypothetical protein
MKVSAISAHDVTFDGFPRVHALLLIVKALGHAIERLVVMETNKARQVLRNNILLFDRNRTGR